MKVMVISLLMLLLPLTSALEFDMSYPDPVTINEEFSIALSIDLTNLTIVEDLSEEELGELEQERLKYNCYEVPGNVCEADETCSGNSIITLDGQCCVNGVCESSDEDGGLAWVGYLIAAIVIIVGVFVWLRYKRVKVIKNPIEKRALGLHKKKP